MDFEELYNLYYKDIYLYIRSLAKDENIADEIAQESFFKALKSIDSFDGSKDIKAWLFTIAKNTYFTQYKKAKKDSPLYELNDVDTGVNIVMNLVNKESALMIHQFLHSMEEPYKEVFQLRVFGELPYEYIGKIFGKSSNWARVTYYRAKMKIKEHMEEMGYERDKL